MVATIGARGDKEAKIAATTLLHLGFGAGSGALFAMCHHRLRLPLAAPVQGVAYAIGVWCASYQVGYPRSASSPRPATTGPTAQR